MTKHLRMIVPLCFLLLTAPPAQASGARQISDAQASSAPAAPALKGVAPPQEACTVEDRLCVLKQIESLAPAIDNKNWRDQTLRELAKTYAFEGDTDTALSLIPQIQTPDTQAMTIRGIGMAAAGNTLDKTQYGALFARLHEAAKAITHPPSHAIALTYIAMAQAFAKDDEGAWKTASGMENEALRHKALAETAEIQAGNGAYDAAMHSISLIGSEAFRNKAYGIVSKIFADKGLHQEALNTAVSITNAYNRAQALQYALDAQKPREVKRSGTEDTQP